MITRFSPFHAAGTEFKSVPAALLYIAIKPSLSGKVAAKPSKEVESPTVLPFQGILRKFAQDDITVFAKPFTGRGNPEDWSTNESIPSR